MIKYLSKAKREDLKGTAILRLDFNTEDKWRMEATLPTIKFLLKNSSKVIILSHKGRPPKGVDLKFSLKNDTSALGRLLKRGIIFVPDFDFSDIKEKIIKSPKGSVFVLENLRFLAGEEKNDIKLAKNLASLGDFYVNDGFAVSHRLNASVAAITKFLPSYGGLQLEREIKELSRVMKSPRKPLVVILGGGKAADKLGILEYFRKKADYFLIGGEPANTLLRLKGVDVGESVVDKDDDGKFTKFLKYNNLFLPVDYRIQDEKILDIGKKTVEIFESKVKKAKTIVWNGPLGLFEKRGFEKGSVEIARAITKNRGCFSLAGGGETVMFLKKYGLDKGFSFISTGGGAMLEFIAGEKLPGVEALGRNHSN